MKKLLLITTSFPETFNGEEAAGAFVYDYCLELSMHVDLHVLHPGSKSGSRQIKSNFTVHGFSASSKALSLLKFYKPRDALQIIKILRGGKALTKELVEKYKVDHIFCLWALPSGYWARSTGVTFDIWALGSDIWSLGKIPIVRTVLRKVLMGAGRLYADGFQLADDVKALSGRECTFLPSSRNLGGVSVDKKPRDEEGKLKLVFLGRWHRNKGVDLLLEALEFLDEGDWAKISEIRIAGGGPLEKEVRSTVRALIKRGRPVTCMGYLDKAEAVDFLSRADWFLLPSRIESVPVIFSDCMQLKLPVVSMPVGDVPRLMEVYGVGFCCKNVDASDFSLAIKKALNGFSVREENFLKCANDFSVESSVQMLLEHIK
ncbi:glycosyltransferase [Pseudoteredinibacter isoporae]|uniref:glycosyltransferase n=1 Tax=Pseudoteredinibacter isoporae TaxID=570281 RepID=UPI003105FAB4